MLFLTHLLLGILVGLEAKDFFSGGNYLIFFALVLLGALLPDIDEGESKISKWTRLRIISFFSKHRGFFHSLGFVVLIVLVLRVFFGDYYAWGLFLGLSSHLLSDGLTKQGINFFYPFSELRLRGWIRTGSGGEMIFQLLIGGLIVWRLW